MKKQIYIAMLMLFGASLSTKAQSKIKDGTIPSSAFPNANAVLELESNKRGLLMPRIALTNTSSASPMTAHIAGMIVYNTATVNDVTPGYYYNDGSSWRKMAYISPSVGGGGNNISSTSSPITVSGGTGSVLTATSIKLDSNALGSWLNKSPMKDSLATALSAPGVKDSINSIVTNSITAGTINGKDLTNSNGIIVNGGIGTTLKNTSLRLDSSVVAQMMLQSPVKDSIAVAMSQSPIKDSINTVVTNSISSGTINGKDLTNGNGIIVSGGTGTTLKTTSLRLDSSVVAQMMLQSPVKDSIAKVMTQSPIKDSLGAMQAWYSTVTNKGASKNTDSVYIMGKVGIGTSTPNNKLEITQGTAGKSGLRLTNLPISSTPVAANTVSGKYLSVNANGDVILANTNDPTVEVIGLASGATLGSTVTPAVFEAGGVGALDPPTASYKDSTVVYANQTDGSLYTWNGANYIAYIASGSAGTEWYLSGTTTDAGSNKVNSIYRTGAIGIGTNNPTAKLTVSNNKSTTVPVLKLDTLLSGNTNDSIMVWRKSDSSVRKIPATAINPSIRQSIHFAVPATTWNSSTTPPSKNQMTNFTGGTGTFNNRTLYECLSTAERANMIVFEGLRMDILTENTTSSGTYIRPRFFNTTGSTITYTITSIFANRLENMANGTVNASYYSHIVDGDDIIACNSSGMETLHFDVYFTNGNHYEGNVGGFVQGTTSTGTYHFWMDIIRVN